MFFTKKAPTIEIDVDKARNIYASIKVVVQRQMDTMMKASNEGKVSPEYSTQFINLYRQFIDFDAEVMRKLNDREVTLDYDNIMKILRVAAKMADIVI